MTAFNLSASVQSTWPLPRLFNCGIKDCEFRFSRVDDEAERTSALFHIADHHYNFTKDFFHPGHLNIDENGGPLDESKNIYFCPKPRYNQHGRRTGRYCASPLTFRGYVNHLLVHHGLFRFVFGAMKKQRGVVDRLTRMQGQSSCPESLSFSGLEFLLGDKFNSYSVLNLQTPHSQWDNEKNRYIVPTESYYRV